MTTDISLKALRETVEVIDALITRLQELNDANLSLIRQLEPTDLTGNIPRSGQIDLSLREISILRLVGQGKRNGEIARELGLTGSYIRSIISRLYDKLEIKKRGELILYAIRAGIVTVNTTNQITEETEHNYYSGS